MALCIMGPTQAPLASKLLLTSYSRRAHMKKETNFLSPSLFMTTIQIQKGIKGPLSCLNIIFITFLLESLYITLKKVTGTSVFFFFLSKLEVDVDVIGL